MDCAAVQERMEKQTKKDVIQVRTIGERVEQEQFSGWMRPAGGARCGCSTQGQVSAMQWDNYSEETNVAAVHTKCYST